ncbi:DUF4304 domain-containing protein [Microbacterium sp. p3-SID336]|uniref:DUF4304 domain-containing protein n=1 Tax=Microbacterium sp. p3-SID336 TaxID=2916212 RepID=UPI0021A7AEFF|nr:DUF4304 domain-containing protein [Microbacterium sp. p3-SID336]MCT1477699.1 DUF4304 domain-containing protein [Microbacterium sp. p3-SID336]
MTLTRESLFHELTTSLALPEHERDDWVEHVARGRPTPRQQLLALLLLMDASPARMNGWPFRSTENALMGSLPRKSLPWDGPTAVFALRAALAISAMTYVCGPALRGAETAMQAGHRDPELYEALAACAQQLQGLMSGRFATRWGVDRDLKTANRLLALFLPSGVLDLTMIHDGDDWAESARRSARTHPVDGVEPLVRQLTSLGHKAPSQTWQRGVQPLVQTDTGRQLVRDWLEAARQTTTAEDGRLFSASNEDLVRATVIAARWLPETDVPAELLGALARQGAATRPPGTESLALRVATASIDTLAQRAAPADVAELERLLDDITRRDLIKRIGSALGPEAVARAESRDTDLKREKAAAVRAKANPIPKILRAEVDRLLREHLDEVMRELGFRKSGRTWRRVREDQVDVVDVSSSHLYLGVQYGVLFPALHPEDGPAPQREPKRVKPSELDLLIVEDSWIAEEGPLDLLAARMRSTISPFLLACGDREALAALLTTGAGMPQPAGLRDPFTGRADAALYFRTRPFTPGLALGALACVAGDRDAARVWLDDAARAIDPSRHRAAAAEADYWRRRVEALPGGGGRVSPRDTPGP